MREQCTNGHRFQPSSGRKVGDSMIASGQIRVLDRLKGLYVDTVQFVSIHWIYRKMCRNFREAVCMKQRIGSGVLNYACGLDHRIGGQKFPHYRENIQPRWKAASGGPDRQLWITKQHVHGNQRQKRPSINTASHYLRKIQRAHTTILRHIYLGFDRQKNT